jgi:hypothetical protein
VWYVYRIVSHLVVSIGGDVDELEDERPSGDNAAAAREEISADDVLENGGFTR